MNDPGQLFYNDDPVPVYNGGACQPFAFFSKAGGEHPYLDPAVIQNLLNQKPPAINARPVQTALLSMLTMYKKQSAKSDLMCISETGSGKTYAFLLPAIQTALKRIEKNKGKASKSPSVLIFCHSQPLAELIYANLTALVKNTAVKTCLVIGKTEFIKSTEFDIGVCCAGRFRNHFEGSKRYVQIDVTKLDLLIIDEVDESMKCADDFMLYFEIRQKTSCPAYFFSATLDGSFSLGDIFRDEDCFCYQHGELNALPPTVIPVFWECDRSMLPEAYLDDDGTVHAIPPTQNNTLLKCNPSDMIFFILKLQWDNRAATKFIIFTKKTVIADFLANKLALLGIKARSIHAKKSAEARRRCFEDFKAGVYKVIVATNQLTRGIDVDVDVVINYDIPTSRTAWIHRSGRVGRNGKKGAAITLVDTKDPDYQTKAVLREIVGGLPPDKKLPTFLAEYLNL
uniref:ATP-dependent RNA helicase n=1 Tax=Panagrellus redivivus TaxID=6233 RepID=A0A7E4UND7_PANRE